MPNFQGAVNELLNQAGLFSSLSGRTQDLLERRRLGKEEKIVGKQIQNVDTDIDRLTSQIEEAQNKGDKEAIRSTLPRFVQQGEELESLAGRAKGIQERKYELRPTEKRYKAMMEARAEYDVARRNAANAKAMMQSQGKKTMMEGIHQYMKQENMKPLSDPAILELLEDDNGKQ